MQKFFLLGCVLSAIFITSIVNAHCIEKQGEKIMKNLNSQEYVKGSKVNALIETTYAEAKKAYEERKSDSAYQLSMPLIASALQGNLNLYNEILPKIQRALNLNTLPKEENEEENAKKAWLLGRVLLAADSIKDCKTSNQVRDELEKMIKALKAKNMLNNAFSAWAIGYLAGSNEDTYKQFKGDMLASATELTQQYLTAKLKLANTQEIEKNKNTLKDLATNAIWAWVMDLQAAANAKDKDTFNLIVEKIKDMMQQKSSVSSTLSECMMQQSSVSSALSKGLSSKDYPAWAYGIVQLAAAKMEDKKLYDELKKPLQLSLEEAKKSGVKTEEMLGLINSNLATIEWDEHSQNQVQSSQQPVFNP